MRRFLTYSLSFALVLAAVVSLLGTSAAWAIETPRKHHPWAAFSPGAWRADRITVQVFDAAGRIVDCGVTEQRTVLEKVDDQGVTLRVEESVWVAGKLLERPVQTVKQGFYGESEGQKSAIKDLEPEMVVVEGRRIPCGVREVEVADAASKRLQVSRFSFNNDVAPFILKRKTTIKDAEKKTILCETNMAVDALQVPCAVEALQLPCLAADRLLSASHVRTTTTHAKGKIVSLAYCSAEVPGRVVTECTKKTDTENRLVEQSVVQMIDCGLQPSTEEPRRRRFPGRLRGARLQTSQDETTEEEGP